MFKSLKKFGNFDKIEYTKYLLSDTLAKKYAMGQIYIVINEQILKNNLVNWSHCKYM